MIVKILMQRDPSLVEAYLKVEEVALAWETRYGINILLHCGKEITIAKDSSYNFLCERE